MSDAHRDEIAKLENLYAENPEGRVFTHLAEAYRKAGDFDRAQATLADGLQRHPEYSSAHVVRGRVLMDQDRTDEAEQAFRRVLELDPHNLIAIRSLAELARGRGADDEALTFYQRLLEQEPGDEEAREFVAQSTPEEPAREPYAPDAGYDSGAYGSDDYGIGDDGIGDDGFQSRPFGDGLGRGMAMDDEADDAEVRTETIAQVYARQGLYDRAAEVYRELVRARPDDEALRDRLAEMEQLAEAQTERTDEVDAVSDFGADERPPRQIGSVMEEFGALEGFSSLHGGQEPEPDADPEPAWGSEPEPEPFAIEGLESAELDTSDVDPLPMMDMDVEETDPETGLRAGATPDTAEPVEDLSEELDVRAVPEPPEESPWETTVPDAGAEHGTDDPSPWQTEEPEPDADAEPDWLAELRVDPEPAGAEETAEAEATAEAAPAADAEREGAGSADDAALEAESVSAEEVWTGADWADEDETDTASASTPHAWTEDEDDATVDPSPPVREYFGGLLGWSGVAARSEPAAEPAADRPAAPAAPGTPGASGTPGGTGTDATDEDDDLDMFRSWLESLKQ